MNRTPTSTGYLLIDDAGIEAARQKAARHGWASAALDRIVAGAEQALSSPVHIPERGGQWNLWYSCGKDGVSLETVSATEHRCPACGATYTGEPYDAVVVGRTHNAYSAQLLDLGLAYRFSGRDEFAARAAAILLGYAERYPSYPRRDKYGEDRAGGGRLLSQTLDEARWLVRVAWAYSLLRDALATDQRRQIETALLLPAADLLREDQWGVHNKQCWMNAGSGLVGFATGDRELIDEAIAHPERGFRALVARGVTDEGLWWEGSLGYHFMVMHALVLLAEAAHHAGIDLYSERFLRMWDAPLALALPDGNPPGFNDNPGTNLTDQVGLYEVGYARTRRADYGRLLAATARDALESLLFGLEDPPAGPYLPERSSLLRSAGYAVLRSPEAAVAVRFGRQGGDHGHLDKLNVVTFGAGALFGLDPGTVAYSVPLYEGWYRATLAHNTVVMTRKNQAGLNAGAVETWVSEPGVTTLVVATDSAYPDVLLRRTLTLRGVELADRFECASATARHSFDWVFHSPGQFSSSLDFQPRGKPLGDADGYQYVEGVAEAETDGDWWARWEQGDARLTVRFKAAPGTRVFHGFGPGKDPREKVPLLIVRRLAIRTVFDALHRFERVEQGHTVPDPPPGAAQDRSMDTDSGGAMR